MCVCFFFCLAALRLDTTKSSVGFSWKYLPKCTVDDAHSRMLVSWRLTLSCLAGVALGHMLKIGFRDYLYFV